MRTCCILCQLSHCSTAHNSRVMSSRNGHTPATHTEPQLHTAHSLNTHTHTRTHTHTHSLWTGSCIFTAAAALHCDSELQYFSMSCCYCCCWSVDGTAVAQWVEPVVYKSEGRWFDPCLLLPTRYWTIVCVCDLACDLSFTHLVTELTVYPFGCSSGSAMCDLFVCLFACWSSPLVLSGQVRSLRPGRFTSSANSALPVCHSPAGSPKTSRPSVVDDVV